MNIISNTFYILTVNNDQYALNTEKDAIRKLRDVLLADPVFIPTNVELVSVETTDGLKGYRVKKVGVDKIARGVTWTDAQYP